MTTCPDCTAAQDDLHFIFRASCPGCQARIVARSLLAFEARNAGKQTQAYRDLLARTGVTHERVREWVRMDAVNRLTSE